MGRLQNQEYIELGRFAELREIVDRDLDTFTGYALERYFYWKFIESTRYVRMGGWWDRKGENEIDLVCENAASGALDFYEIKRDRARISLKELKRKVEAFFVKNPELKGKGAMYKGLGLAEM